MPKKLLDPYEENAKRTPEERRKNAIKAGKASGAARRKNRTIRATMESFLQDRPSAPEILEMFIAAGLPEEEQTFENAIALSALLKAGAGDMEASRYVRDTLGQKPTDSLRMSITDKPIKSLDLSALSDEELEALADSLDD